jgi:hypothetical protein
MKMSIPKLAFLLSAVAHVVFFWLAAGRAPQMLGQRVSERQTVTARFVFKQDSVPAPKTETNQRNFATGAHVQKQEPSVLRSQLPSLSKEGGSLETRQQLPEVQTEVEQIAPAPGQIEVANTSTLVDEFRKEESLEVFSSCQAVVLPKNWVQRADFFPRRYTLEFVIQEQPEGTVFAVRKMIPDASEFPYADRLIRRTFENCMNQLGRETIHALEQRFRALNPQPTEAYSLTIEFDKARAHAGQSKGI